MMMIVMIMMMIMMMVVMMMMMRACGDTEKSCAKNLFTVLNSVHWVKLTRYDQLKVVTLEKLAHWGVVRVGWHNDERNKVVIVAMMVMLITSHCAFLDIHFNTVTVDI